MYYFVLFEVSFWLDNCLFWIHYDNQLHFKFNIFTAVIMMKNWTLGIFLGYEFVKHVRINL